MNSIDVKDRGHVINYTCIAIVYIMLRITHNAIRNSNVNFGISEITFQKSIQLFTNYMVPIITTSLYILYRSTYPMSCGSIIGG